MRDGLAAVSEAISACADAAVWGLSDADLVTALDEVHCLEQRLASVKLALVREVDGRDLGVAQGATSSGVWLRQRLRMTVGDARRLLELAKTVDGPVPALGEALAAGAVSVEQARAIAAVVKALPAEVGAQVKDKAAATLIDEAGRFDPGELRRLGAHILSMVAPEVAEQHEREALQRAERRAHRGRWFTLSPDGAGGSGWPGC